MAENNALGESGLSGDGEMGKQQFEQKINRKRNISTCLNGISDDVADEIEQNRKVFLKDPKLDSSYSDLYILCDEILLEIFGYCDSVTLIKLSRTCHRFYNIIKDRKLWKEFDLSSKQLRGMQMFKKFHYITAETKSIKLRGLTKQYPAPKWNNETLTPKMLRRMFMVVPELESITIIEGCLNFVTLSLSDFPRNLKTLIFESCESKRLTTPFFTKIDTYLPNLVKLSVENCRWFEPHDLMMLSKLQFLKVLILKGCRTLKETVPYASIATRFGFPSLEVLDVRDTPISDCDIQCFSLVKTLKEVLMECPGEFVKKSQLSQTPIIDDGIGSGSFSGIGNGCASGSGIGNGSGSGCQSGIGIGSGSSSGCSTSSNSNTNKTVEVNYDSEDSVFNVSDDDDKDDKDDNAGNEKLADRGKNYHENIYNISYNPEENRIVHIFVRSTEYDPAIFLPHENRAGRVPQTVYAQILPENREISFFRHSRLIPGPQQEPIECRGDVDDSEDSEEDEDEDDEFEIFPPIPTGVPRPAPALSPQEYIHASSFRLEAPQPTYVGDRGICSFGHSKANGDMILIRADNELPKFTSSIQKLLIRHYKNVTDLSLRHLIECAPDLQYIDVTGTSVTADGVQLFKNVKPLCTVLSNFD